jgi:hypothetical protein
VICRGTLIFFAFLLASATPAHSQVIFELPDGDRRAAPAIEDDVRDRSYTMRDSSGGSSSITVSGASLPMLLRSAGIDPLSFTFLQIDRPAGGSVFLTRRQATDAKAFEEGPPLVFANGSGFHFIRPSAGPGDNNAGDRIDDHGELVVALRTGTLIDVDARASRDRARPRTAITFKAAVARAAAGERLNYSWYFDDGSSAKGPEVTHSFARTGTYDVVVGVTSADDDVGGSSVVSVRVGKRAAGPRRKGGGTNRDALAPDSGVASAVGAATSATTRGRERSTNRGRRRTRQRNDTSNERVSGTLLASLDSSAATNLTGRLTAARTGSGEEHDPGAIPASVWAILAALVLFGGGAWSELRTRARS